MAIGDDFTIDYVNKRIWNKYAWGQGGTATVYSVNALYSYLMDTFDEQGAMDDDIPMSAQTPSAYSMINEWFMDDESHKYLKEGAIVTVRGDTKIALLTFQASGYTNCVFSDITKQIVWAATERGPLLAYNNTARKWWVRTTASFTPPTAITITGGTGAGTATAFDNTGEDIFANIYTLGTIESGTDIYIYQAGSKISAWWSTGHIDVLIKVKEYGSEIDGAEIIVYARVYTDLYDFYLIDLTAGGRNAVPLATSDDLDNATAIATVLNYMDSIRIMFVGGTLPYGTGSGNAPVAHKVIHGGTSNATAFILNAPAAASGTFTLANIEGTFQNAEVIEICEEIRFDAQTSLFTVGTTIKNAANGSTATAVVRKIIQDPQGAGNEGILFVTNVTGTWSDNDPIYEGATQRATQNGAISTNTHSATTTATVTFAATTTKDLDNGAGAQPYNVIVDLNGLTVKNLYELVKALNRRLSTIQTFPTNGTDTRYAYNGEFYQKANTTYTQVKKASPFGTFAGGKFFGARGIWIEDMVGTDAENYSLIDALNATQNPPTSSTIKVVSMIVSTDRVILCESTGSGQTAIKRNQYIINDTVDKAWSYNANTAIYADETTDINNATANDVALPPIQIATVGDAILVGRDGKFGKFRLNVGTAGVHSGVTLQWQYWNGAWVALTVTDPTNFFKVAGTNNITFTPPADWVENSVNGISKYWIRCIVTVLTAPTLTTAPLGTQGWLMQVSAADYVQVVSSIADDAPSTGVVRVVYDYGLGTEGEDIYSYTSIDRSPANDKFIISGTTAREYDVGDRAYNPYVDALADAGGEREVILKYSGVIKYIVTRVRLKGYIPFQVAGSFASGITTITAIRTVDGIVT